MDDKKKRIIESAVKLFADNGFHLTTMQEIASQIGISKGSLYLHFKSKEELILSIIQYYQDEMFMKLSYIAHDEKLTPMESLRKQIYMLFSKFQENGDFIKIHIKEQLNHESDLVRQFMEKSRIRILNWEKQTLANVFGEEIKPYLLDITLIYHGIIGEYRKLIIFDNKEFDFEKISAFIVDRMIGIVEDVLENKPEVVLTEDIFPELADQDDSSQDAENHLNQIPFLINEIKQSIHKHKLDKGKRTELISTIQMIENEIHTEDPRQYLLNALLSYLKSEKELTSKVKELTNAITIKLELNEIDV